MTNKTITEFRGDYFFLSNFYPCDVINEGVVWPSVEHAYQAAKTLNVIEKQKFISLSAKEAKKLGSKVELRANWEADKLRVMRELLLTKFKNNEDIKQQLIDTGDRKLLEVNNWGDTYWGLIRSGKCLLGENHLGKLLMEVRRILK